MRKVAHLFMGIRGLQDVEMRGVDIHLSWDVRIIMIKMTVITIAYLKSYNAILLLYFK